MKVFSVMQRLHLWMGLILGVQVFLWLASGAVMSVFDIALVRGETNALSAPPAELVARGYANPGGVIAQTDGATSVKLKTFLGRAAYEVESPEGFALFDADSGDKLSPLPRDTAREIARKDYIGDGEIGAVEYLTAAPGEFRGRLPVWRVTFTDDLETRIYISPETGAVVSRRNSIWRLYDFFWMLHIMDYEDRTNFNNPLLKIAAISGTLFAATGFYLVIALLLRGRYRLGLQRAQRRGPAKASTQEDG